jgi:glucosyl-dolichyl phosphate glucuronosyltransferase
MIELSIPSSVKWELLVVNNNCSDSTDEVISHFSSRLPIKRLFEARPGKSNALNRAVQDAKGKYLVCTDDDVLVDSRWLIEYKSAFEAWPDAVLFGGPVEPWFQKTPPPWLLQVLPKVSSVYALRDCGSIPLPL